jgi:hypothetical protein
MALVQCIDSRENLRYTLVLPPKCKAFLIFPKFSLKFWEDFGKLSLGSLWFKKEPALRQWAGELP